MTAGLRSDGWYGLRRGDVLAGRQVGNLRQMEAVGEEATRSGESITGAHASTRVWDNIIFLAEFID